MDVRFPIYPQVLLCRPVYTLFHFSVTQEEEINTENVSVERSLRKRRAGPKCVGRVLHSLGDYFTNPARSQPPTGAACSCGNVGFFPLLDVHPRPHQLANIRGHIPFTSSYSSLSTASRRNGEPNAGIGARK